MKTISLSLKNLNELKTRLNELLKDDFKPTVAVSFSDPDFDLQGAMELFRANDIHAMGCTTAGEICDCGTKEKTFTILLMDMPKESFKVMYEPGFGNDYSEPASKLGNRAREAFKNPAILVYSGGIGVDGESIVRGIKEAFDREIPIYGGLGADHFHYNKVCTYTHKGVFDNGLSALVIDTDKIKVGGKTFSGWDDLGKTHLVTKAEGNILLEVDGKPALDLFNNYFKGVEYRQKEGSERLFTIPGIYSLKVKRDNGVEFMRSTLIYDFERKALILAGGIKKNDKFKFCPTPSFSVVELTIDEYRKMAVDNEKVDALIMNSCAGRQFAFGPMFDDEVEGIYDIWKVPMVGYMAYGEIGNTGEDQICEFHNVTCSLVSLTEK